MNRRIVVNRNKRSGVVIRVSPPPGYWKPSIVEGRWPLYWATKKVIGR